MVSQRDKTKWDTILPRPFLICGAFQQPEEHPPHPCPFDLPVTCTQTLRSSAWPPRDSPWTHPTRASAPGTPAAAPRTAGTRSQESSSCKRARPAQSPAARTPHTVWASEKTFSVNGTPRMWHKSSQLLTPHLRRGMFMLSLMQLLWGRKSLRSHPCRQANPSLGWF